MNHFASPEFWFHYRQLPAEIRELADKNFELLKSDPRHPSLRLKKIGRFWSVRVGRRYRALARDRSEGLVLVLDRAARRIRTTYVIETNVALCSLLLCNSKRAIRDLQFPSSRVEK